MKRFIFFLCCCSTALPGCSYFGYYRYERAVRAPAGATQQVQFPDSYKEGIHTDGRLTRALAVAMNDYLPPGARLHGDNPQLAQCLSRWDTYDVYMQRTSDELFFIYFLPVLSRCGLDDAIAPDAGAEYAIDGQGRILDVH